MDLTRLLQRVDSLEASDLHLKAGKPPLVRLDGSIEPLDGWPVLNDGDIEQVVSTLTQAMPGHRRAFEETGELDMAFEAPQTQRFRVNAFRQRGAISIVLRLIPKKIPNFAELHLPRGVARLAEERRGLVLATGATGAGKSMTLAAILDHINRTRRQHIITIEDPVEMLHADNQCIVSQREVGVDTASFKEALRRALRQDPDVILIGELRDAETAQTALQAAESGHLVLATLHTVDAAETIGRLVEFFPSEEQAMIRSILAGVLRGVVSQRLLPGIGGGRAVAVEVMIMNDRIADLVREDRADEIPDAIADGAFYDMQTISQALIDLVLAGRVERDIAANAAPNPHNFVIELEHAERLRAALIANPALPSPTRAEVSEPDVPEEQPAALRVTSVPTEYR